MDKIAFFRRFVRVAGLAAFLSLGVAACELSTAPPFPDADPDPQEQEDKDPQDG
jgi:hypothetical protein